MARSKLKIYILNHTMEGDFGALPTELLVAIAEIDGETTWRLWFLLPRFAAVWSPRASRELFIVRNLGTTKVFGHLHSVDDFPAVTKSPASNMYRSFFDKWYYRGQLHRGNDLPAIILFDRDYKVVTKQWFRYGVISRDDDRPHNEHRNGRMMWNDEQGHIHRDNGPAIIWPDGTGTYYNHGTAVG